MSQEWLQVNCRNSSETINGLQIRLNHGLPCLGGMLEAYHKLHPQHKSFTELKEAFQVIWDSLPQEQGC